MSYSPLYDKTAIQSISELPMANLAQRWTFVGIDMAPNASLESGMAFLDRDLTLLRMDKLYSDDAIIETLKQFGAPHTLIVCLDMPKNLSIPGRFRQEEIKNNAMRLDTPIYDRDVVERFSPRGVTLYDRIKELGALPLLTFTPNTKSAFQFFFPYKSRSPQGCRALQSLIDEELGIKNMPNNLAPSSVLEALIAAYSGWMLMTGTLNEHYSIVKDLNNYFYMMPKTPCDIPQDSLVRPEWVPM